MFGYIEVITCATVWRTTNRVYMYRLCGLCGQVVEPNTVVNNNNIVGVVHTMDTVQPNCGFYFLHPSFLSNIVDNLCHRAFGLPFWAKGQLVLGIVILYIVVYFLNDPIYVDFRVIFMQEHNIRFLIPPTQLPFQDSAFKFYGRDAA